MGNKMKNCSKNIKNKNVDEQTEWIGIHLILKCDVSLINVWNGTREYFLREATKMRSQAWLNN